MLRIPSTSMPLLLLVSSCRPAEAPVSSTEPAPGPVAAVTEPKPASPTRLAQKGPGPGADGYFPLEHARRRHGRVDNREAPIPLPCYTRTDGQHNPCWACHTESTYPNLRSDTDLQEAYAFSDHGRENRWTNAFVDRREAITAIDDETMLEWVRHDNYSRLRELLQGHVTPWAYPLDLDVHGGFDDEGFARDGSHWRAFRYKPFVGTFWPTNGSTDDVFIRLPAAFRQREGQPSIAVYKANLALLEASLASDPRVDDTDVRWPIEPLDEQVLGVDLDADGMLESSVTWLHGLPDHYLGDAAEHSLHRGLYPEGTEFLHSVRYLDPDAPGMIATRMKELRYLHKEREEPRRRIFSLYEQEANEREEGVLPRYHGDAETGLLTPFGWRVQGYIEDARGRLRLQTQEEHLACMGCHSGLGVTADGTFSFPRKVPGAAGWGYQSIDRLPDVPQLGHDEPEVLTYLRRAGGGDELRANDEILTRFMPDGVLDDAALLRAAPGGDRDLGDLIIPSPERALALDKAYLVLVREQAFERGRDAIVSPPTNVHRRIDVDQTGLREAERVYRDGTVRLDWSSTEAWSPGPSS
ncbi:hypothetical protein [Paraliomyxa miuraensis]|uniref:hypothetical protein n=1 Tax=Paraliomyxa miuraensis TaxID=376150 RepID=UPI0022550A2E|nr:hypothetical protein [Paraliomyxa miuraensis]MCX4245358.1 hypothetical protein [Paraliomyxa miuraensis]